MTSDRTDLDPVLRSGDDPPVVTSGIVSGRFFTVFAAVSIALLSVICWNVVQQTKLVRQNTCISRAYLDFPAQRTEGWRSRVAEHCGVDRVQVDLTDPEKPRPRVESLIELQRRQPDKLPTEVAESFPDAATTAASLAGLEAPIGGCDMREPKGDMRVLTAGWSTAEGFTAIYGDRKHCDVAFSDGEATVCGGGQDRFEGARLETSGGDLRVCGERGISFLSVVNEPAAAWLGVRVAGSWVVYRTLGSPVVRVQLPGVVSAVVDVEIRRVAANGRILEERTVGGVVAG